MEQIGFSLFVLMGITLGLIGAGGAILAIPILIYFFKVPVLLSTTYSLFIVGGTTLFGAWRQKDTVAFHKAFLFAVPSLFGVFSARYYLLPSLPDEIGGIALDKAILLLFVLIMFMASIAMFRQKQERAASVNMTPTELLKIGTVAFMFGGLMGILGIGGGFLILPALVLLLGLKMKEAISTSLFIIMLNSAVGFVSDRQVLSFSDYQAMILYTSLGLIGLFIGSRLSAKVPGEKLKKAFAIFIAFVAILIALKETYM